MDALTSHVVIDVLHRAADARGFVFEPLDALGLHAHNNVHVVLTARQQIRGNHYHLRGAEVSAVVGPARVRYRDGSGLNTLDVPAGEVWRFTFPPHVPHAFLNTGELDMLIVSFNSLPHDPATPDVVREVIL